MKTVSRRAALAGVTVALTLITGCELANQPTFDGVLVHTAEVAGDTVRIGFSVDEPQGDHYKWYVDLDTDQALDASGKKTGYGEFGLEFEIDSRDQLGDSVAIRPTSGPIDTSGGARGWPIPVGYAKREPSKWITLRFPASLLGDDGILAFNVVAWDDGQFGFFDGRVDSTHARPPEPHALTPRSLARARVSTRRSG